MGAFLCEFLARVFSAAPDTTFVGSCRHGVGAALLTTLAENDAQFPAVQQMTDALAVPPAEDKVVEQLERVYTRLFSGVAGPDTVSPFASAHLQIRHFELPADVGVSNHEFGSHVLHRLVHSETRFHAHHHQVQGVGQPMRNGVLTAAHFENTSEIRASLFQLMPYLSEVLGNDATPQPRHDDTASARNPEGVQV